MDKSNEEPNDELKKRPRVFLAPSQDFEDLEWHAAEAYAKTVNRLDYRCLEPLLDEDTIYESQHVLEPMVGRERILHYLKHKFITINQAGESSAIQAEMAYMNSTYVGRPTVILYQGGRPIALVLFEMKRARIARIDICGVLPTVDEATGTGEFPE